MKIKTILLTILITFVQSVNAEDTYDLGRKLAICSAKFETLSVILNTAEDTNKGKFFKERANGWMIGSVVSFMADGIKPKVAWSAAEGEKETAQTAINIKLEAAIKDKSNMIKFSDELMIDIDMCSFYDEVVDESIKLYRKII